MNKERRKSLAEAIRYINKAKQLIDEVLEEEDDSYNNMNEGLQATMRGEQMYDNISEMEEAIQKIDEVLECLEVVD